MKLVYYFGGKKADGKADMKGLLGGKGANLAEMVNLKLPVPPGFTITTEVCTYYYDNNRKYPKDLKKQVMTALGRVEKEMGMKFGDIRNPLLLSVRSGARASMPGMMDTILNLGLNDDTVQGLISKTGNPRFVYDSYRRFVQMYGDVVLDLKPTTESEQDPFEMIIEKKKHARGVKNDLELTAEDLKELVHEFKSAIRKRVGKEFPDDPEEQLWGAISSVFNSWMNERAIVYRRLNNIPESWGTAVNIQSMVFGNMGENSGTGVAFTRDAASGENVFYGEYLMNAQGEDVVAGIRTPLPIVELEKQNAVIYKELDDIRLRLEKHYRDMLDLEFTIQEGKLYILQCRVGKRTGLAAARIAVEMEREGLINEKEALLRIEPEQLNQLLRPVFDLKEKRSAIESGRLLAKGLNAGPGAASGKIYFNATDVVSAAERGEKALLVRIETSPEDIKGMNASEGILTQRGGMTSHAALVARQMGKVCVAGCSSLLIDYESRTMRVDGPGKENLVFKEGDYLSIDGTSGEVIEGRLATKDSEILQVLFEKSIDPKDSEMYTIYEKLMTWSDKYRTLKIRTNADQPDQSSNAISFGAEGIGLCRTEHMFFGGERIQAVREMILADSKDDREKALSKLFPYQRDDFMGIFRVMEDRPVTIRTLDPPLHEFIPHSNEEQQDLANRLGKPIEAVLSRIHSLHEFNPMMGHRGCRLGIIYPEITAMQARAIFDAAAKVKKEGINVQPEVMIPLVGTYKELENQANVVHEQAKWAMDENGVRFDYLVGTMIEVPRAAITADEIAKAADFFSFGTNDLTQMGFGLSRDDSGKFLPEYVKMDILEDDPFITLDKGIKEMVRIAVNKGRSEKNKLKLGICGEHGGDPRTIYFCHEVGLDYVSCSPFRIPIARISAAQIAIRSNSNTRKRTASVKKSKRKTTSVKLSAVKKKTNASARRKIKPSGKRTKR